MPDFLPDTSCMVAVVCPWHEHHERARRALESRLDRGERMVIAGHCLAESYSVLTRLPAGHRLAPADARDVIDANFGRSVRIVALDAAGYVTLLRGAPEAGVRGGRTYDAIVVACARLARVQTLVTFNARHFDDIVPDDIAVHVP